MNWRIHHKATTLSTNLDARVGAPGDVYVADFQSAGRGRLDHRWLSSPGENLMMSAVVSVAGHAPESVATLPLIVGLAVAKGLPSDQLPELKWPNDVMVGGRKIAGILCERVDDCVIVGIGVNVNQREFPREISDRATSLGLLAGRDVDVAKVRDLVLASLGEWYGFWLESGFAAAYPEIAAIDWLRGKIVSVIQTDGDPLPINGQSAGILPDGSLDVGGVRVYAGEAHVTIGI